MISAPFCGFDQKQKPLCPEQVERFEVRGNVSVDQMLQLAGPGLDDPSWAASRFGWGRSEFRNLRSGGTRRRRSCGVVATAGFPAAAVSRADVVAFPLADAGLAEFLRRFLRALHADCPRAVVHAERFAEATKQAATFAGTIRSAATVAWPRPSTNTMTDKWIQSRASACRSMSCFPRPPR